MSKSLAVAEAPVSSIPIHTQGEDWIISQALFLLEQRVFQRGPSLLSPGDVRQFLRLKLAAEPNEVFAAIFLDSQNRVIAFEPLFHGTVDAASVYPRVVLKRALEKNAAALILSHNHPSGVIFPVSETFHNQSFLAS